ncbi:YggS family pyridoxal phosphate-dependent enzyme [Desulforhabdus amnigena]|jgi:pyridoxal phosphate enzyme (YggS family)|uniref:Pyridoxal phosphate homeostasis protein n=1 Tax=Desulforhabdus amnigena TaxID=40218 RepID=A0A9W6FSN9_9BACT|nr:YggS family pyridoxal phosphate-dependent enzyme [Desulforhabdus amnigena]NLJ27835.1 YggS family pyridoxal phosphate-dependent enzyme [Deltaproteobacteria bacterium]GLI34802.1 YggS family pyridoxal phosphate enzyme [Desulforhabdus amnigena]
MTAIAENLSVVRKRIEEACLRCGRNPSDVRLVGVTKTVPVERIREGVLAGITILGENYIQEARKKIELLSDMKVSWHFIGHLQSNKAAVAAECFDWVETVDRESLARELNRQVQKRGKRLSVLLQVNVGEEESKSGVSPGGLPDLFRAVSQYDGLIVRGLMTLPPYFDDPNAVRPYLRMLRQLLEQLREAASRPEELTELSMGMSNDFEVAIEEGSTLVRIGTALFGSRST